MNPKQVIFSDRLTGLAVHNNLVRMDLASFAGMAKGNDDKPQAAFVVTHQIVMPLDAFLQSVNMQLQLVNELRAREQPRRDGDSTPAVTSAV